MTKPDAKRPPFAKTVTRTYEVRPIDRFGVFDLGRDDSHFKVIGGLPIAECGTREEAERIAAALVAGAFA